MKSQIYIRLTMVFTAILMFTYTATSQTTVNYKIAEANDDCEEVREVIDPTDVQGFMDHGSSDLELCTEDNLQYCGMVYRNIQIPAGATITNAYIQFTCDDDNAEEITLEIYGALDANVAAPIGEDLFSISKYTPTTAVVSWTPPPWLTLEERGPDQQTPDISSIIQEIIDLEGWASGNNLMIVITDDEPTKIHRESEAWEDNDGAGASELFVTFTEGGTGETPITAEFSDLIYPNPTDGKLFIDNPSTDKFSYEIFTVNGKLVSSRDNITGPRAEVDLSGFAKGTYLVDVRTTGKKVTNKLILK
jgi:hypothetical protein